METAETIELFEEELDRLIMVGHKSLNYWEILKILLKKCSSLAMQSEVELYQKGGE